MNDEYGKIDSAGDTYVCSNFQLENGYILPQVEVRYNSYGQMNKERDNVLVVCHALTGNSRLDQWWSDMLGPNKAFDTNKYYVLCANALGSCYGTTGPTSINPLTNKPYGITFPEVTIRDTVALHLQMVREGMQVKSVCGVVGGSM
eukprot:CAMPEP_0182425080 /NCGR_PEP_ID=MMETSP1167-20130531/11414_1 /TAXON_ID=2988 /ORGANISM="Mallomonas Sp, Strain CCMP3275" /LENGTH=145 /DNA_ID=CAMNT_0024605425 /DNA_START=201 /DNA_END=635 /DNA_ORIENTATION=+